MSQDTLSQMSAVTEAMFQREFNAIQGLLKKEAGLRQSMAQLDAQSNTGKINDAQDCAMKTIGADILWQAWVSKTRRQLNIELAQVMAQKIEALAHIRKAFGRKEAVKRLLEAAQDERHKKVARLRAERLTFFC